MSEKKKQQQEEKTQKAGERAEQEKADLEDVATFEAAVQPPDNPAAGPKPEPPVDSLDPQENLHRKKPQPGRQEHFL